VLATRSSEQLVNDVNISFARNYISPFVLKNVTENTARGEIPIIVYIEWGLRARGVFDDGNEFSDTLRVAYELGLFDGRISAEQCIVDGNLNLFLVKKHTLLFLCEYGDEIIYSRLVLESGKQINFRTAWILEACCPDLMHSEIRIFSNLRTKLLQCLPELQSSSNESTSTGKKFVANKATKLKITALETFQAEILQRNSIDIARCLKIHFENGKCVHKGNL
jgi:hypothetical protein